MSTIENATITKEANIYFDGKVTSRSLTLSDGSCQSLGIMLPGEYEFATDAKETMQILSGQLDVLLPGQTEWQAIKGGESFDVPASSKFQLKIHSITDYCCLYLN